MYVLAFFIFLKECHFSVKRLVHSASFSGITKQLSIQPPAEAESDPNKLCQPRMKQIQCGGAQIKGTDKEFTVICDQPRHTRTYKGNPTAQGHAHTHINTQTHTKLAISNPAFCNSTLLTDRWEDVMRDELCELSLKSS